jgi:hypothetical protein
MNQGSPKDGCVVYFFMASNRSAEIFEPNCLSKDYDWYSNSTKIIIQHHAEAWYHQVIELLDRSK